jgi:hypothetical protein
MNRTILPLITAFASITAFAMIDRLTYPQTRKADVVDDYFGNPVPDPYRWRTLILLIPARGLRRRTSLRLVF